MEQNEIKDLLSLLEKVLEGDSVDKLVITIRPKKKGKS